MEIFSPDLILALGFFTYVMWRLERSDTETYNRTLNERREFGYRRQRPKNRRFRRNHQKK